MCLTASKCFVSEKVKLQNFSFSQVNAIYLGSILIKTITEFENKH